MIDLGDKVKDPISGVVGTVIGLTDWLYNTRTAIVSPEGVDSNGLPKRNWTFKVAQMVEVPPEETADQAV